MLIFVLLKIPEFPFVHFMFVSALASGNVTPVKADIFIYSISSDIMLWNPCDILSLYNILLLKTLGILIIIQVRFTSRIVH